MYKKGTKRYRIARRKASYNKVWQGTERYSNVQKRYKKVQNSKGKARCSKEQHHIKEEAAMVQYSKRAVKIK